ncbi:MAG: hypothetical protein ACRDLB_07410 [Actinomycetota bacterium]
MKRTTLSILLVLLVTTVGVGTAVVLHLSNKVQSLERSLDEDPSETDADEDDHGTVEVPGIEPPDTYLREAIGKVDKALVAMARAQQELKDSTGAFTPDPLDLMEHNPFPNDVTTLQTIAEPTAFCIEAVHVEVKGTRRRFISVTGAIDSGICSLQRPLAEQVGMDRAATSGGHYEISDVRLVDRGVPPAHPDLGTRYDIVFDAKWVGAGEPVETLCAYSLFSARDKLVKYGEWAFGHYELSLDDYRGPAFFQGSLDGIPVRVELECENRY